MRRVLVGLLLAAAVASAQEGFPLDGTWRGERPGTGATPVTIVMIMQWDGHKVRGVINPGPAAIQIADVKLDPDGWKVSLAARSSAGEPISFEGVLADLGKYNRTITGTWTEGGHSDQVRMVRE